MRQALWQESAVELASGIRGRRFSFSEVMVSVVERIRTLNPKLNAIVIDLTDQALAEAAVADRSLKTIAESGPLFGVPLTIKVNVHQEGQATTNGVPAFANLIAPSDSPLVRNLRRAGAIIVGRTNRIFHALHDGKSVARTHVEPVASGRIPRGIVWRCRSCRCGGLWSHPSRQRHRRFAADSGIREWRDDAQTNPGSNCCIQSVGNC
jgi:hypothetical protein